MKKSYLTASIFAAFTFVASASMPLASFAEVKDPQALQKRLAAYPAAKFKLETLAQATTALPEGALQGLTARPNAVRISFGGGADLTTLTGFIDKIFGAGQNRLGFQIDADEKVRGLLGAYRGSYDAASGFAYMSLGQEDVRDLQRRASQAGLNVPIRAVTMYNFSLRGILGQERLDDVIVYLKSNPLSGGAVGGDRAFYVVKFLNEIPQSDRDTVFFFGDVFKRLEDRGFSVHTDMPDASHLRIHAAALSGEGAEWLEVYRAYEPLFRENQGTRGDFVFGLSGDSIGRPAGLFHLLDANGIPYTQTQEGFVGQGWNVDHVHKFNQLVQGQFFVDVIDLKLTAPVSSTLTQGLEAKGIDTDTFVKTAIREYKF